MRTLLAAMLLAASMAAGHATEGTVTIDNFSFKPAEITVLAGSAVTWVNHDDIPHLVVGTSGAGLLKSPVLDTDDAFTAIFATPGVFAYFCSLHPHMQGTVIVR